MTATFFIMVLAICVLLEGFFSGTEMAVVHANKHRLILASERGSKWAGAAMILIRNPALFFSTTLLGTNVCTVIGSVVATLYIIVHYGEAYAAFAILFWP